MSRPFLWGWAGAAVVSLVLLIRIRSPRLRATVLPVFGIAAAMFLAEALTAAYGRTLSRRKGLTLEYTPKSHLRDDSVLGYSAVPGARVRAIRKRFGATLYDVTYTISDQGARVTRGNPAGETWLFMGCSFTFGEGVSDDETLPAQFSEQLGGAANVLNLGLNGYGPHQMLRMLETGRLGGATRPVKHVIYQALVSHVPRAAGRATWGLTAPAYVIAGDSIRFGGQLNQSSVVRSFAMFQRSDLARLLLRRRYDASPTDEEIELFARIVEKAAEIARTRLGARFTILFWDYEDETTRRVHDRLVSTGLPVIRATSLVAHDRDSLRIPYDRHPSAEAYRRLASGLAAQLGAGPPNKAR